MMANMIGESCQVYLPDGSDKVDQMYQHDGSLQLTLILILLDVHASLSVLSCLSVCQPNPTLNFLDPGTSESVTLRLLQHSNRI